jgi:hypothetical protein
MIKISLLLTFLCFIFFLVGCSNPQINKHITEDKLVQETQALIDKKATEASLASEEPESKLSIKNQSRQEEIYIEKTAQKSEVLSDKAFEREQYYIETPVKDPTLGNQSSEHENEFRSKLVDQNKIIEDQHSEVSTTELQTIKSQKSEPQVPGTTSKEDKSESQRNQPKSKNSVHGKSNNKESSNPTQQKAPIKKEATGNQKENNLAPKSALQKTENKLSKQVHEGELDEASNGPKHKREDGHHTISNHNVALDADKTSLHSGEAFQIYLDNQTHHLKLESGHTDNTQKKSKRHWNMQRQVKPINTSP